MLDGGLRVWQSWRSDGSNHFLELRQRQSWRLLKAGNNQIVCNGPTSQEVDIGPFDFSWKGNSYGVGMGLTLGTGLTGPCVVHDSYFLWDMGSSSNSIGAGTYSFTGCSSLTIKNSVFRIRNPKTGQLDALWNGATQGYIQIHVGAGPRSRAPGEFNSPLILEYDAIINCPERCFTTGTLSSEHNYFQGINMKDFTAYAAHGDGWLTTFYNGPTGPSAAQICNCTGLDTLMEKFDTWMTPNYGAGSTSCITCAMVNVPGPAVTATIDTRAPNVAHVTSISGTTFVAAGSAINSRNVASNYTYPGPLPQTMPRIAGCPGNDCAAVDPASCTSATPCDYTLNVNWPNACSPCSWGLLYPSNTITADYENNVYPQICQRYGGGPSILHWPRLLHGRQRLVGWLRHISKCNRQKQLRRPVWRQLRLVDRASALQLHAPGVARAFTKFMVRLLGAGTFRDRERQRHDDERRLF